jgi:hypothetical protein
MMECLWHLQLAVLHHYQKIIIHNFNLHFHCRQSQMQENKNLTNSQSNMALDAHCQRFQLRFDSGIPGTGNKCEQKQNVHEPLTSKADTSTSVI